MSTKQNCYALLFLFFTGECHLNNEPCFSRKSDILKPYTQNRVILVLFLDFLGAILRHRCLIHTNIEYSSLFNFAIVVKFRNIVDSNQSHLSGVTHILEPCENTKIVPNTKVLSTSRNSDISE
jgi:hypothetical protein